MDVEILPRKLQFSGVLSNRICVAVHFCGPVESSIKKHLRVRYDCIEHKYALMILPDFIHLNTIRRSSTTSIVLCPIVELITISHVVIVLGFVLNMGHGS